MSIKPLKSGGGGGRPTTRKCFFINPKQLAIFYNTLTLIAIPDCIKINIVLVIGEEEEAEPRIKGIYWDNKEDPYNMSLFIGTAIRAKVHIDLRGKKRENQKH